MRAAQRGNLDAFELLVLRYQATVVTTAYHFLHDEAEADDVSQEVWIRVYRSLPRFRFQSRFSTWLYRITVNQAMTAMKKGSRRAGTRRQDVALDDEETFFDLPDEKAGPLRILEGREAEGAFREALDRLPPQQRAAVVLVLLEGLPHREAAEVMGVAEKTVSWHVFKARERLMEELREHL